MNGEKVISKKGIEAVESIIVFTFVIGILGIFIVTLVSGFSQKNLGQVEATEELSTMAIMYKLITSKECLSTGKTGVLDASLLDGADGKDELECAYLPDFGWYVVVEDLKTKEKWKFGYKNDAKMVKRFPVSIRYEDKTNPGQITLSAVYQKDDILVFLASGAERAWAKGSFESIFFIKFPFRNIYFRENEICDETDRCKKLFNAQLEEMEYVKVYNKIDLTCKIIYKKEGNILIIEEFWCVP